MEYKTSSVVASPTSLSAVFGMNDSRISEPKDRLSPTPSSFRERRTFGQRVRESDSVRTQHPNKIPVIVERYANEKNLPDLDKSKFLVPSTLEVGELARIMRRRLELNHSQTLFLLVNGHSIPGNSLTLAELYQKEADGDGFLYIVYASHEVFGSF